MGTLGDPPLKRNYYLVSTPLISLNKAVFGPYFLRVVVALGGSP